MKSIHYKILALTFVSVAVTVILLTTVALFDVLESEKNSIKETATMMQENYDRYIKGQVMNAYSVLESFNQKYLNGEMT